MWIWHANKLTNKWKKSQWKSQNCIQKTTCADCRSVLSWFFSSIFNSIPIFFSQYYKKVTATQCKMTNGNCHVPCEFRQKYIYLFWQSKTSWRQPYHPLSKIYKLKMLSHSFITRVHRNNTQKPTTNGAPINMGSFLMAFIWMCVFTSIIIFHLVFLCALSIDIIVAACFHTETDFFVCFFFHEQTKYLISIFLCCSACAVPHSAFR